MTVIDPDRFSEVLAGADGDAAVRSLEELPEDADLRTLGEAVEQALDGSRPAVGIYVSRYRCLTREALQVAHERFPDRIVEQNGGLALLDAQGVPVPAALTILDDGAVQAPFSPWVNAFGVSRGLVLDLAARLRQTLDSLEPLRVPKGRSALPHWDVDAAAVETFVRRVRHELSLEAPQLQRIAETFGLTDTELARLFGVTRQAIGQWKTDGVPPARSEKVAAVAAIADLLARKLKADRLPGIARRPADAYGGRTMLELIQDDRHGELLDSIRSSFAFATTA